MTHSPLLPCPSLSSRHISLSPFSLALPTSTSSSLSSPLLTTNLSVPFATFVSLRSPSSHSYHCTSLPALSSASLEGGEMTETTQGSEIIITLPNSQVYLQSSSFKWLHNPSNMRATNKNGKETSQQKLIRKRKKEKKKSWKRNPSTRWVREYKYAEQTLRLLTHIWCMGTGSKAP